MAEVQQKTNTEAFLSGKLSQVDVERIERELRELWKTAAKSSGDGAESGSSVTRACSANLVLYTDDADAEVEGSNVLDEITVRHPSRAILAISRQSSQRHIEAWVSARCHLFGSKKDKQICSEQITVRHEGEDTRELASVVMPLILSDLPVFVWWRADSISIDRLAPFLGGANKLIFDSTRAADTKEYFNDICQLHDGYTLAISDLSWSRIYPWREALAHAFSKEGEPLPLSSLHAINQIDILYSIDPDDQNESWHGGSAGQPRRYPIQAVLFAAWVASRLDWRPKAAAKPGSQSWQWTFEKNGSEIVVNASGTVFDQAHMDIHTIALTAAKPHGKSVIARQRAGGSCIDVFRAQPGSGDSDGESDVSKIVQRSGAKQMCELPDTRLIDEELDSFEPDRIYEESLAMASRLLGMI